MALDKNTINGNIDRLCNEAILAKEGPLWEWLKKAHEKCSADAQTVAAMNGVKLDPEALKMATWERVNTEQRDFLKKTAGMLVEQNNGLIPSFNFKNKRDLAALGNKAWDEGTNGVISFFTGSVGGVFGILQKFIGAIQDFKSPENTNPDGTKKQDILECFKCQRQKEALADWGSQLGGIADADALVAEFTKPIPPGTVYPTNVTPFTGVPFKQTASTTAPTANAAPDPAPQAQPPAASQNNTEVAQKAAEKARIAQAKAAKEKVVADAQGVTHDDSACSVYLPLTGKTVKTHAKGCPTT